MKKETKLGLVLAAAALLSVSVASLVSARGWVQQGADWYYVDNDGEYVTETIQTSGNTKFYLGEDGTMQKDYFLEDYNSNTYYFGSNGAMVTNTWVAIESDRTDNQGDYVPDNYWYYFQASGKAVKGTSDTPKKQTIDGKKYMFNEYGQMCTGWIDANGVIQDPDSDDEGGPFTAATYYAGGDNDGVLRTGWVTYYDGWNGDGYDYQTDKANIYFYFNTTNNKKQESCTKKINGKTYAFDGNGMMISGWDAVNFDVDVASLKGKTTYFSGDDDGHQVKKGWVYAVPAESIDPGNYEDGEEKYFYFGSSGDATTDQFKKVNGKYYAFSPVGIMKTGVVIWCPSKGTTGTIAESHFVATLDLDWAEGSDVAKKGLLRVDKDETDGWIPLDRYGYIQGSYGSGDTAKNLASKYSTFSGKKVKLHLFGDDGARKTGTNTINFSDDAYTFVSNASGNKESGYFNKKYYSLGIQLKANADVKYGIFVTTASWFQEQQTKYANIVAYNDADKAFYEVVNTSGARIKNAVKKDADGNYWIVDGNHLRGIYNVEVKYNKTKTFTFTGKDASFSNTKIGDEFYASDSVANANIAYGFFANGFDSTIRDNDNSYVKIKVVSYQKAKGDNPQSLSCNVTFYGPQFKSDYDGKANVMLPFGLFDDSMKTASLTFDEANADSHYQVVPNNDYFLNCFWSE